MPEVRVYTHEGVVRVKLKGAAMESLMVAGALTMTSLEIAELTGKEHRSVLRDIRRMLKELDAGVGLHKFVHTHVDPQNSQSYPIFRLPKRETLILVSGYNVTMRARIIDRWQELEAAVPKVAFDPASMTRLELLELAVESERKLLEMEGTVKRLAAKSDALNRIAQADGLLNITNAAKVLQWQPLNLFKFLSEKQWIYRRPGGTGWVAYQDKIQAGYLTHKVYTKDGEDGTPRNFPHVLVTGKGLARLSLLTGRPIQSDMLAPIPAEQAGQLH